MENKLCPERAISHRIIRRSGTCLALVALLFQSGFGSASSHADERTREVVSTLLRALVESQINRDGRRDHLRPDSQNPPRPDTPAAASAEMLRLRPIFGSLAQETGTLSSLLQTDAIYNHELRQCSFDVLQFHENAKAIQLRASTESDHRRMMEMVRRFNADWKTISHQLRGVDQLNQRTKQSIQRIDGLDLQYCQLLGIVEQVDGREIIRVTAALEADLRTLADEIQFAPGVITNRAQIVGQIRRSQEQIHHFSHTLADGATFQTLVAEYQAAYQTWTQVAPSLDAFQNQSVIRAIDRIQDGHGTMHRLLRLPLPMNATRLLAMARRVQAELTTLSRTITLEQLLSLPDARHVLSSADATLGCTENLVDVLSNPNQIRDAGQAWFYLNDAWSVFAFHIRSLPNPETRAHIEHAEQMIDSLRCMLGIRVAFDMRAAAQRAASIHAMADKLQLTVNQWVSRPGKQNPEAVTEAEALENRSHQLDDLAMSRERRDVLRAKCDEVIEEWQHLRTHLVKCDTPEREVLDRITETFIPELVRMRVMLDD